MVPPSETRPLSARMRSTSTPAPSRRRRAKGSRDAVTTSTGVPGPTDLASRLVGDKRRRPSITMRVNGRRVRGEGRSSGSSARAVPMPMRTASCRRRSQRAWARWAGLVIHREWPLAAAIRPSRVKAAFSSTKGRPSRTDTRKRSFRSRASSWRTPVQTATPARRSTARPLPFTRGLGSRIAATTRLTPESPTRGAQGGVRPKCEQGSRVT